MKFKNSLLTIKTCIKKSSSLYLYNRLPLYIILYVELDHHYLHHRKLKINLVELCKGCVPYIYVQPTFIRMGKWMAVPSLASRRSSCGVTAQDGYLYCVGGNDGTMCLGKRIFFILEEVRTLGLLILGLRVIRTFPLFLCRI